MQLTQAQADQVLARSWPMARALAAGQRFAPRADDGAIRAALKGCKGTEVERAVERLVAAGLLPPEGLAATHRRFAATPAECRAIGAPESDHNDVFASGASRGLALPPKVSAVVAYARDLDGMRFAEQCARECAARFARLGGEEFPPVVVLHRAGSWPAAERRLAYLQQLWWTLVRDPYNTAFQAEALPDLYGSWDRGSGRLAPVVPREITLDPFSEWLLARYTRHELLVCTNPSPRWPEGSNPYAPACDALARGYAIVTLKDELYTAHAPHVATWIWQLP